jgi:hypothetical protein
MKEEEETEKYKRTLKTKEHTLSIIFMSLTIIFGVLSYCCIFQGIINDNFNYKPDSLFYINNFKKSREICNNPTLKLKGFRNKILSNNNNSNSFYTYSIHNSNTGEKKYNRIECDKKFLKKINTFENNNISNYLKKEKQNGITKNNYMIICGIVLGILFIVFFILTIIYIKKVNLLYDNCIKTNEEINKQKLEKLEKELEYAKNKKERKEILKKIYYLRRKKKYCSKMF